MFGYIDLNPKTLTEEQEGRYKAWYCGLCRTIRDAYGQIGRVALSNDMTFLTVLLSSLYEPEEKGGEAACPVHPLHRRAFVTSQLTRYAADMNMLLAYWKAKDSERDGEGGVHRHMLGRLQTIYGELSAAYPEQCRGVQTATEAIWEMETKGERQIDRLCALSGDMLGAVFAAKDDIFAPVLREIGRGLGAFIYLMDAYEDEEEDAKKGRFNPLGDLHTDGHGPGDREDTEFEALIRDSLTHLLSQSTTALDLLPLSQDLALIENVLYEGVWNRYLLLQEKDHRKKTKEEQAKGEAAREGPVQDPGHSEHSLGG